MIFVKLTCKNNMDVHSFKQKTLPFQRIFWTFVLTIIVFLGINITFVKTATADVNDLPDSVAKSVLQDASKRSSISTEKLRIIGSVRRDWSDGCLGLAQSGTMCTQQVIPGWQVKVVSGQKTLVYRTNNSGSIVKLESL